MKFLKAHFLIFVVTLLILSALVVIYTYYKNLSLVSAPTVTTLPHNFPPGTTLSVYSTPAPNFPNEIILGNENMQYSGVVSLPLGKTKTSISYITTKSITDTTALYVSTLPTLGWKILTKSVFEKVAILKVEKGTDLIVVTIASAPKGGTAVTFQYEK